MLVDEHSPLVEAELHYRAVEFSLGNDLCPDIWFLNPVNEGRRRKS